MTNLDGSCHCGNIRYRYSRPGSDMPVAARQCGCTFCRKHGALWTSDPGAELRAEVREIGATLRYTFATATAEFWICRNCGALTFAVSEIGGKRYAVINVNTLEGVDVRALDTQVMDFDGERREERLARRSARWIADVEIHAQG